MNFSKKSKIAILSLLVCSSTHLLNGSMAKAKAMVMEKINTYVIQDGTLKVGLATAAVLGHTGVYKDIIPTLTNVYAKTCAYHDALLVGPSALWVPFSLVCLRTLIASDPFRNVLLRIPYLSEMLYYSPDNRTVCSYFAFSPVIVQSKKTKGTDDVPHENARLELASARISSNKCAALIVLVQLALFAKSIHAAYAQRAHIPKTTLGLMALMYAYGIGKTLQPLFTTAADSMKSK